MRIRLTCIAALQFLLALTLVLAACDSGESSGPAVSTEPTATSTFTPSPTRDPAAALALNAPGGETVSNLDLHIVGVTDASPGQPYAQLGIACSPNLVFASSSPSTAGYSPTELQAIRDYVTAVPLTENGSPIPDGQPPSAVRWLSVGLKCGARLDVHNSGGQTVTISSAGLQLISDSVPNTYRYVELELCSISYRFWFCGFSGQGPDEGYSAVISLGSGRSGTPFQAKIDTYDPNNAIPLLLLPGQTKSIILRIQPADMDAPGAIYRVVPQLTVTDSATHVVTFSSLQQTIVFAARSQIACYGLAGNSVLPPSQIHYDSGQHSMC